MGKPTYKKGNGKIHFQFQSASKCPFWPPFKLFTKGRFNNNSEDHQCFHNPKPRGRKPLKEFLYQRDGGISLFRSDIKKDPPIQTQRSVTLFLLSNLIYSCCVRVWNKFSKINRQTRCLSSIGSSFSLVRDFHFSDDFVLIPWIGHGKDNEIESIPCNLMNQWIFVFGGMSRWLFIWCLVMLNSNGIQ